MKTNQINPSDFARFVITGYYAYSNKKFRMESTNAYYAFGINLWRGKVWGVLKDSGKRKLLKSIYN